MRFARPTGGLTVTSPTPATDRVTPLRKEVAGMKIPLLAG
jgi:hypothetical protein